MGTREPAPSSGGWAELCAALEAGSHGAGQEGWPQARGRWTVSADTQPEAGGREGTEGANVGKRAGGSTQPGRKGGAADPGLRGQQGVTGHPRDGGRQGAPCSDGGTRAERREGVGTAPFRWGHSGNEDISPGWLSTSPSSSEG